MVEFTKTSSNPEYQAIYDASRSLLREVASLPADAPETSHDLVTRVAREHSWRAAQGALVYLMDNGILNVDRQRHVTLAMSGTG